MNSIYLDIGNSSFKLAEKQPDGWKMLLRGGHDKLGEIAGIVQDSKEDTQLIFCSVRKDVAGILQTDSDRIRSIQIKAADLPSELLNYNTPATLGIDRFLACFGAATLAGSGVIVVDSGTACTVDYMSAGRVFFGGVIMPGLPVLKNSMSELLPELPEVKPGKAMEFPGKSTEECLRLGIYEGFASSVSAFIRRFKKHDPGAAVFLTGGDARLLQSLLKGSEPFQVNEFLIFEGMEAYSKI